MQKQKKLKLTTKTLTNQIFFIVSNMLQSLTKLFILDYFGVKSTGFPRSRLFRSSGIQSLGRHREVMVSAKLCCGLNQLPSAIQLIKRGLIFTPFQGLQVQQLSTSEKTSHIYCRQISTATKLYIIHTEISHVAPAKHK